MQCVKSSGMCSCVSMSVGRSPLALLHALLQSRARVAGLALDSPLVNLKPARMFVVACGERQHQNYAGRAGALKIETRGGVGSTP